MTEAQFLPANYQYEIKEGSIAVCHSVNSGPVFGLNDLEIVENCNTQQNYFSNIGTSYEFYGEVNEFYGDENYNNSQKMFLTKIEKFKPGRPSNDSSWKNL